METDELQMKNTIMKTVEDEKIDMIRLQFVDIFGFSKNVAITSEELPSALDGELMFDGSSVDGFGRIEESDMYLVPDLSTFRSDSWNPKQKGVAHIMCDVHGPDGKPFKGCPRVILKSAIEEANALGYSLNVGPEGEFFLFERDKDGKPTFEIHDEAGYFDLSPIDLGEDARRDIIVTMKNLGFSIEASHHEVAPGQHEIDFKYGEALHTADQWMIFKQIVKATAHMHGLYASFIAKPFSGENANAMHCNQSLSKDGKNAFYDPNDELKLSQTARYYIGGLLKHAKGIAAICNPTVNSYKRLVPGYEAPTNIAWSYCNRSALIRIPLAGEERTRVELRTPDPMANPYLVYAVMLKAGLDGIKNKIEPPAAIDKNIYDTEEGVVKCYPRSLFEALEEMKADPLIKETLGEHTFDIFMKAKLKEWQRYEQTVHEWEIDTYFNQY